MRREQHADDAPVRPGGASSATVSQGQIRLGDNSMTTSSRLRGVLLGTAIAAGMGIGYAIGAQPHMNESIAFLQSARGELQASTPNKGGHRERAIGLIDQAIGEVRAGIAFAGG
jgi:hypothetical protein